MMAKGNCEFSGTGGNYVVTVLIHLLLLGMITGGIYSAWAWVRLFKQKASNTIINGKRVSFTGDGLQLFLLILVQGILTIITFGFYAPWAICKFLTWKAHNTQVDSRPNHFTGTGGDLFLIYLIHIVILPMITLGLYYFIGLYRFYAWKEEHTEYGGEKTSFGSRFGDFLKVSLISFILNTVTFSLFLPWSICMLYRWQVNGLMVGEPEEVEHFPVVVTNMVHVAIIIAIGLIPFMALALFFYNSHKLTSKAFETSISKQMLSESLHHGQNVLEYQGKKSLRPFKKGAKTEIKALEQLIKKEPENVIAFFNRGCLYHLQGNRKKALKDYSAALRINKSFGDAYFNRGLIYVNDKKFNAALDDFNAALKLTPQGVDIYCNRGNIYHEMGRNDLALLDYNKAISIRPDDGDIYYNRGIVYLAMRRKVKAENDFKKATELGGRGHIRAREHLKKDPQKTLTGRSGPISLTWQKNLDLMKIPHVMAQGKIYGDKFVSRSATIHSGILTIRDGQDFFPDHAVEIFLFVKKGEELEDKQYLIDKSTSFNSPHIYIKWKEKNKDIPQSKVFMKDYVMRLEFGAKKEGKLSGGIYLCLPDDQKSIIAGHFSAIIK